MLAHVQDEDLAVELTRDFDRGRQRTL